MDMNNKKKTIEELHEELEEIVGLAGLSDKDSDDDLRALLAKTTSPRGRAYISMLLAYRDPATLENAEEYCRKSNPRLYSWLDAITKAGSEK